MYIVQSFQGPASLHLYHCSPTGFYCIINTFVYVTNFLNVYFLLSQSRIGWRNHSRKMLLFSTDADFHYAGDGKVCLLVDAGHGVLDSLCYLRLMLLMVACVLLTCLNSQQKTM